MLEVLVKFNLEKLAIQCEYDYWLTNGGPRLENVKCFGDNDHEFYKKHPQVIAIDGTLLPGGGKTTLLMGPAGPRFVSNQSQSLSGE